MTDPALCEKRQRRALITGGVIGVIGGAISGGVLAAQTRQRATSPVLVGALIGGAAALISAWAAFGAGNMGGCDTTEQSA